MFRISEEEIEDLYEKFMERKVKNSELWVYSNQVLYEMCEREFANDKKEITISKLALIGRAYAAAIERVGKTKMEEIKKQNIKDVTLAIMNSFWDKFTESKNGETPQKVIAKNLREIKKLSLEKVKDKLDLILKTHDLLTNVMKNSTNLEKRSLTSKYLHFHCPNAFFIYDSRARESINSLVKKPAVNYSGDREYVDFCLRVLKLQEFIKETKGKLLSPREIDDLLLYYVDEYKKSK